MDTRCAAFVLSRILWGLNQRTFCSDNSKARMIQYSTGAQITAYWSSENCISFGSTTVHVIVVLYRSTFTLKSVTHRSRKSNDDHNLRSSWLLFKPQLKPSLPLITLTCPYYLFLHYYSDLPIAINLTILD
jgi:hypothetical protein